MIINHRTITCESCNKDSLLTIMDLINGLNECPFCKGPVDKDLEKKEK